MSNSSLFLKPQLEFHKVAAETALPEDPNAWSDEVLQELFKQIPYLADFDVHVVMETVDAERAYGLGHAEVTNKTEAPMTSEAEQLTAAGVRQARIPVIIRDGKLQPFDVVLNDKSEAMPLTETRLRQALFRPQNFDVTSRTPGDQSMIGQLYPPYRQSNGFGSGTTSSMGGKTASADGYFPKTASVLEGVLSMVNVSDLQDFKDSLRDRNTKLAYAGNPAAIDSLIRLAEAKPLTLEKRAHAVLNVVHPTVLQVSKHSPGYLLKSASHHLWAPLVEHVDRGEVVRRCGEKVALAADMAGSATVAGQEGVTEGDAAPNLSAGPVDHAGMYSVESAEGEELSGVVIPNLLDVNGSPLPIALFTDGQRCAVQSDISGTLIGDFNPPGAISAQEASGHGVFYNGDPSNPVATLPLTLGGSVQDPGEESQSRSQATTFDSRQVSVSVQPYVQSVMETDGVMLVPDSWQWIPLSDAGEVALTEHADQMGKQASAVRSYTTVQVRGGGDCFSLSGSPVEKLASDDRSFLSQDDALFLLVGLGAEPRYAQQKLAAASLGARPEEVRVATSLKLAHEVIGAAELSASEHLTHVPVLRHRMWKEAALLTDPTAVDAVLSLGFLNPENIATFVGYLPTLDEAQHRLCELLIAARLGLRELSEGALERAIRSLEDVVQGLRLVAFQG